MDLDYTGPQGGLLALAFAAGCVACFAFCALIGKFLWGVLEKAKDNEIACLKASAEEDRQHCREMEERLNARIASLEGALLMGVPGHLRAQVQAALSEQRYEIDQIKRGDE
ncbi:hypothetical protein [Sphingomonas sp.]|uniref:hypothetical protein n=1 Tax=Sphingomonas sp. TaxID=28214 RepID=UPI0031D34336